MVRALAVAFMAKIKIRLELETDNRRQALRTIEVATVPRVGEKFETGDQGTLQVIEVVHTPLIREWDAVVVLKAEGY